jgi:hypothetical protein
MAELFENVCGEIVRRKYPDSLGEHYVDALKKKFDKDICDAKGIYIAEYKYGKQHKEFMIFFTSMI